MKSTAYSRGISFIEMVISIGVLVLITVITIGSLAEYRRQQALEKSATMVTAVFEKARAKTLSNENQTIHSVRINNERLVLFPGVFSSSSPDNEFFSFDPLVEVGGLSLTNGTNTISYRKLSGQALATGTIELRLRKNQAVTKDVTIYSSGLIEIN